MMRIPGDMEKIWEHLIGDQLGVDSMDYPVLSTHCPIFPSVIRTMTCETFFEKLRPACHRAPQVMLGRERVRIPTIAWASHLGKKKKKKQKRRNSHSPMDRRFGLASRRSTRLRASSLRVYLGFLPHLCIRPWSMLSIKAVIFSAKRCPEMSFWYVQLLNNRNDNTHSDLAVWWKHSVARFYLASQTRVGCTSFSHISNQVIQPPDRQYLPWIGGSMIASHSAFRDRWISNHNYDEVDPSTIERMSFSYIRDQIETQISTQDENEGSEQINIAAAPLREKVTRLETGRHAQQWISVNQSWDCYVCT